MKIRHYFLLVVLLVALDQLAKFLAYEYLDIGNSVDINEFFSLTFAHNYGAAFGFLADSGGWQRYFLSIVSAVASDDFRSSLILTRDIVGPLGCGASSGRRVNSCQRGRLSHSGYSSANFLNQTRPHSFCPRS